MRLSPYFSVGLALISLEIDAFSPLSYRVGIRLSVAGHGERNYRRSSFIHRSTAASDSPETKRKDAAVQALEKLLDRQKAEVEDTQTLLTQLKKLDLGKADAQTMNRAASVLSGVDYGFVSRSEGAAFDKLHGGIYNATTEGSVYEKYGPPANIIELGVQQFMRNLNAIKGEYKDEADVGMSAHQGSCVPCRSFSFTFLTSGSNPVLCCCSLHAAANCVARKTATAYSQLDCHLGPRAC